MSHPKNYIRVDDPPAPMADMIERWLSPPELAAVAVAKVDGVDAAVDAVGADVPEVVRLLRMVEDIEHRHGRVPRFKLDEWAAIVPAPPRHLCTNIEGARDDAARVGRSVPGRGGGAPLV